MIPRRASHLSLRNLRFVIATVALCGAACSNPAGLATSNGDVSFVDDIGLCVDDDSECGGEITGTWRQDARCVTAMPLCYDAYKDDQVGALTQTFAADGSLVTTIKGEFVLATTLDLICAFNAPKPCDELSNAYVTCTEGATNRCDCSSSRGHFDETTWSTYFTNANEATLYADSAEPREVKFCVRGNVLTTKWARDGFDEINRYVRVK